MLLPARVEEVRSLLREGRLSQRAIARRTRVSRGAIAAIALGRRKDRVPRSPADDAPPFDITVPPRRCGGCGAMVFPPCRACAVEPTFDETRLAEIRGECRALATANEFAINGHENRISYIVGNGHRYRAAPRPGHAPDARLLDEVQRLIEEFVAINDWRRRQQEIIRRGDRDGECFIRLFPSADGSMRLRFVEPDQVATPLTRQGEPNASFGVLCEPGDVETAIGYFIDGRLVDASEIQHRKTNVDANVKRGLPLYFPVRKNLRRAEKLLRNMSVVAEIQSAIAIIRKHAATASSLEQFVRQQADGATVSPGGRATPYRRYAPGTILDASVGTEYEFPAAGLDVGRYVAVLQAELRAIASRLVMPEFMLTSDASNANYSSTMVAEGPAVRMFERLQHDMLADDVALLRRALRHATAMGRVAIESLQQVEIVGTAPNLAARDRLREAEADEILVRNGAMSVATMSLRHGLDPKHEASRMKSQLPKSQ